MTQQNASQRPRDGREQSGRQGEQQGGYGPRFGGEGSAFPDQSPRHGGGDEPRGQSSGDEEFDPDYYQWRSGQMRALDDDYRTWRREDHSKKFSVEFETWRDARQKSGSQNARRGSESEGERAPNDQGNAITSQEQNENVAERALEEERDK